MKYYLLLLLLFVGFHNGYAQDEQQPGFQEMYDLGLRSYGNGNFTQAITYLNKAVSAKPDAYQAYHYRSRSFYALHLHEPADADIETMLRLNPNQLDPLRFKADYHFLSQNFSKAIDAYGRLINAGLRKPEYFTARGVAKQALNDFFGSIDDFDSALSINSNFYYAQYQKAVSFKHLDLLEKSLNEINTYIAARPEDKKGYFQRGLVYFEMGEGQKAINDYSQCIKLDSGDVQSYLNRGGIYHRMGHNDSAIADFNEVIERYGDVMEAYFHRAVAYQASGEKEKAFADYTKTIEIQPNFALAYLNRGVFYFQQEQFQLAIDDFNYGIALTPTDPKLYFNRGLSQLKLEQISKAIVNFDRAIDLDNRYGVAYHNRGIAKAKLGNEVSSCFDFRTALNLGVQEAKEYINIFCEN